MLRFIVFAIVGAFAISALRARRDARTSHTQPGRALSEERAEQEIRAQEVER